MYSTLECHFKPNHKKQSDMVDPVILIWGLQAAKFVDPFEPILLVKKAQL